MPQTSYVYAVARVRTQEKGLIDEERMMRLKDLDIEDFVRSLREAGYGDMPEAGADDVEEMISRELKKAAILIEEISPEKEVTDLFLLRADIHNLKMLLKARMLSVGETGNLDEWGLYGTEELAGCVSSSDYSILADDLSEALYDLERELAGKSDSRKISTALDRAYLEHAFKVLKKHKNKFAIEYFKALADFENILAMLRIRKMGGGRDQLVNALLPEGEIPAQAILDSFSEPMENLSKTLGHGMAAVAISRGLAIIEETGRISALEKERDDYLISLTRDSRYDLMTLGPVVGYLLAREQEARSIRLIATAKKNGLSGALIDERLRELYG